MSVIESALQHYNANTGNNFVGDCVARAISLAVGKPYDVVRADLNRLKRSIGATQYNIPRVFDRYLKQYGIYPNPEKISDKRITVSQFCDEHPTGTYLLLTDSRKKAHYEGVDLQSDHMCCVVNGDLYDSWDSQNGVVKSYYTVGAGPEIHEDVDILALWNQIEPQLTKYLDMMSSRYSDIATNFHIDKVRQADKYTIYFAVYVDINNEAIQPLYRLPVRSTIWHRFTMKISPTTTENDVPRLYQSMKQKIYDWWYMVNKDIQDRKVAETVETNPQYRGDKKKLVQLPEWVRPLITYYRNDGNPSWEDKFYVIMDALPDDPRASRDPEVSFRADTLTELKYDLEQYRKSYDRYGYDY